MRFRLCGKRFFGACILLAVYLPLSAAADPVELLEEDSQAFLQDNGGMDVIYSLTFRDNEGRSAIRKIGPFYEPVHFTRGLIKSGGRTARATIKDAGGGFYRVDFVAFSTRAGESYTLELHYRSAHRFADPTARAGKQLVAA